MLATNLVDLELGSSHVVEVRRVGIDNRADYG
jgi:hypothetical protein